MSFLKQLNVLQALTQASLQILKQLLVLRLLLLLLVQACLKILQRTWKRMRKMTMNRTMTKSQGQVQTLKTQNPRQKRQQTMTLSCRFPVAAQVVHAGGVWEAFGLCLAQ